MAAPGYGIGEYKSSQISYILSTAFTGFKAAFIESQPMGRPGTPVVVHTGYWGCGAFGGNRELMSMLQMIAAKMAGITRLVFHAVDEAGVETVNAAKNSLVTSCVDDISTTAAFVAKIVEKRYQWGAGNGT